MIENIDEEPLDNSPNNESEKSSDDIIPTTDTKIITQNQEAENMEVHHHPNLHHNPKKWKEYFLEFLMIFLAVTMGFIAENIREHFVMKKHEKEYMVSLVRDLNNDITGMTKSEALVTEYINDADSIFFLFKNANYKNTSGDIYYLGRVLGFRNLWRSNDGTIQQLIYSGGLRLIENKSVIDSLQDYINNLKELSQILSLEDAEISEYRKAMSKVFSGFTLNDLTDTKAERGLTWLNYNPDLHSTNKNDVNDLAVQIVIVKTYRIRQSRIMKVLQTQAASIIKLINKEYNLGE